MRTPISTIDLRSATSAGEALRIMRDEHRTPLAGATDVYVAANFGTLSSRRLLDIWRVPEWRGISVRDDRLVIGALSTYTDVIRSSHVIERLPMLIEAARQVGGAQIQNRGTIGGNIANASPAGDTLPVFAAADAAVVLRSVDTERRVAFTELFTGYRATVLRADELIVAVEVPIVSGTQWFRKVGTRAAQAISKVVMAGVRDDTPRLAIGSVAPTVLRLRATERVLAHGASLDAAVETLAREIAPIDDLRSTASYRSRVAGNLLRRFWTDTSGR